MRISGSFSLWFETKTAPGRSGRTRFAGILSIWGPAETISAHSFSRPMPRSRTWSAGSTTHPGLDKLQGLSQAIDEPGRGRELVSEKEELLRELQALFEEDNLVGDPRQVVVVPAGTPIPSTWSTAPTSASPEGLSDRWSEWPSTAADRSSARSH